MMCVLTEMAGYRVNLLLISPYDVLTVVFLRSLVLATSQCWWCRRAMSYLGGFGGCTRGGELR